MKKLHYISIVLADKISEFIGSWKFIIIQSCILTVWVIINADHIVNYDPYPFILLNLFLSFQAAYATPMILMSGNRQSKIDREHIQKDLLVDKATNVLVREMQKDIQEIKSKLIINEPKRKSKRASQFVPKQS